MIIGPILKVTATTSSRYFSMGAMMLYTTGCCGSESNNGWESSFWEFIHTQFVTWLISGKPFTQNFLQVFN
ncbi:MAG: hypothetical protein JJE30_06580 [Desulfuromonadales bacterium]|nr:hypothetical protein [Desulfuromonadales bacterium]